MGTLKSMSGRTWVAADHHFGHRNILTFAREDGTLIRGSVFKTIEEHDETIISNHNEIVDKSDRVYLLGDVCINRRNLSILSRLNGRKVLVKGNHDIFQLKDYLPYFDDIRAYVVQNDGSGIKDHKVVLSHIPIHPESVGRCGTNIHGHLHENKVKNDDRYVCVSLEHTDYKPIEIHTALKLRDLRVLGR